MACAGGCGPGCCGDDDVIQVGSGAPRFVGATAAESFGGQVASSYGGGNIMSLAQATGRVTPLTLMPGFVALFEGGGAPKAPPVVTNDKKCPVEKCSSKATSYAFAAQESPPRDTKEAREKTATENATRWNDAVKRACDRAAEKCKAAATATCAKDKDDHCECANAKPGDCKIIKLEHGNTKAGSDFISNNLNNTKDPEAQAEAKALALVKGSGSAFLFVLITVERPCSGECSPKKTVK